MGVKRGLYCNAACGSLLPLQEHQTRAVERHLARDTSGIFPNLNAQLRNGFVEQSLKLFACHSRHSLTALAICQASTGGTALPICRSVSRSFAAKMKSSGNDWIRAASRIERRRGRL